MINIFKYEGLELTSSFHRECEKNIEAIISLSGPTTHLLQHQRNTKENTNMNPPHLPGPTVDSSTMSSGSILPLFSNHNSRGPKWFSVERQLKRRLKLSGWRDWKWEKRGSKMRMERKKLSACKNENEELKFSKVKMRQLVKLKFISTFHLLL